MDNKYFLFQLGLLQKRTVCSYREHTSICVAHLKVGNNYFPSSKGAAPYWKSMFALTESKVFSSEAAHSKVGNEYFPSPVGEEFRKRIVCSSPAGATPKGKGMFALSSLQM